MKRDEGQKLTDEQLAEIEKRIREIYGEALAGLEETINHYFDSFAKRDAEMQKLLKNGEITEEKYKQWRLAQMGRGKRFELMRDQVAERLTKANETAYAFINDRTPGVYTLNRNYGAYNIERYGVNANFVLYDEATVRYLIVKNPDLMPYYPKKLALKRGIDLEYGKKQITASVTRGILMGRSTRDIAADLRKHLTKMEIESALRAARTAVTAAENGGRAASDKLAVEMGIPLVYEWKAAHDSRTRRAHGMADGQTIEPGELFTVGGEKLEFPGDASHGASGWNLYNCRCRRLEWVKGHAPTRERYPEWLERRMEEDPDGTTLEFKKVARAAADKKQWEEYRAVVKNAVPNKFAEFQEMKYTKPEEWEYAKGLKRYLTAYPDSSRKYYDIQKEFVAAGIGKSNVVLPPERVRAYILPSGKHMPYHIMERMAERGITDDEVRSYVEEAKIMLAQWGGKRRMYLSNDGVSVVTKENEDWLYKTTWKREDFDEKTDKMMEVIKNAGL